METISRDEGEESTLAFIGRKEVGIFPKKRWNLRQLIFYLLFLQIKLYRKPVVAILSTGNDMVDLLASTNYGSGRKFDTNTRHLFKRHWRAFDMNVRIWTCWFRGCPGFVRWICSVKSFVFSDLESQHMFLGLIFVTLIELYLKGVIHFGRVSGKPLRSLLFWFKNRMVLFRFRFRSSR